MTAEVKLELDILDGPNYERDEDGWEHHAYRLSISRLDEAGEAEHTMETPWKQGLGVTSDPTLEDVLEAMASDAATLENAQGFEEWASELGYDSDSRKAEAIYRQVVEQTAKLKTLLGDDFNKIVYAAEEEVN